MPQCPRTRKEIHEYSILTFNHLNQVTQQLQGLRVTIKDDTEIRELSGRLLRTTKGYL